MASMSSDTFTEATTQIGLHAPQIGSLAPVIGFALTNLFAWFEGFSWNGVAAGVSACFGVWTAYQYASARKAKLDQDTAQHKARLDQELEHRKRMDAIEEELAREGKSHEGS